MSLVLHLILFLGLGKPTCECAHPEQIAVKKMAPDNLVITEIMQNPSAVSDTDGEWFEVFNPGATAVNLNGWTIRDNDIDSHLIAIDVFVPTGGYAVLARNGNPALNGGIVAAYQYSGFLLANGADEVLLVRPDTTIADEVTYNGGPSWPDPTGASMELSSAALDNNDPANWAEATEAMASGDLGTPGSGPDGAANLVISEIMQNPSAVSDTDGEWFEVFNPGPTAVNLNGWTIRDNDTDSHLIATDVFVPAGGYAVLARNSNPALNGGIVAAYQYSGFLLANGADEVVLVRPDTTVADEVTYDGGPSWPDPTGASMELSSAALDNNDPANWAEATAVLASGDKGTPGDGPDGGAPGGNQAPIVSAGPDKTAFLDTSLVTVTLNGSATDPDGDPILLQWTLVSGDPLTINIHNPTSAVTAVDFTALGLFTFELSADDGEFTPTDTVQINITTRPENGIYSVYFGNLHSHSGYSDGNQSGDPNSDTAADAFRFARDQGGLDFLVVSDHNHSLAGTAIADYHAGALEADVVDLESSTFVAIYGAEWGTISSGGHVIYNASDLWGWEPGNYDLFIAKGDYTALFAQIAANGSFGQLCHPGSDHFGDIFNNGYNAQWDDAISIISVRSGPAFSTATDFSNPSGSDYIGFYYNLLNKGYHLGPAGDQDSHYANWGLANEQRTAVLATDITRPAVLEALRAGRTFATTDRNVVVDFLATHAGLEYVMSGIISAEVGQPVSFDVLVTDPDGETISGIDLLSGQIGGSSVLPIASASGDTLSFQFTPSTVGTTDFFLIEATQQDGQQLWSAPIWVETVASTGNNPPVAGFTFATLDLDASFTDSSSDSDGTIASWNWDFGDGNGSSLQNPNHSFAAAGTFLVTLTVTDDDGATGFFSDSVTATAPNQPPSAAFSFSVTDLDASFTDSSSDSDGTIASWNWDFGDGNGSSLQNPNHSFAAAGTFLVTLTVTDDDGATGFFSDSVTTTAPNQPPSAAFSFSVTDLDASFTDSSSDNDGTIASWNWDFGDGNGSSLQNPNHSFAAAGTYSVTLTVTDDDGATGFFSDSVTATAPNQPPSAAFSFSVTDLDASFTDSSSDSDGTIASWNWDFGDGNGSSLQNPNHSFAAAGTFLVTLTVTDNDGATGFFSTNVTVSEPVIDTLIITEIMQNPKAVRDNRGEWFEVYNPASSSVNLNGWTIRDDGSNSHIINQNVTVPAGGYAVLGRNADTNKNGGINLDYQYSGITLANGADEIILERPDGSIADEVWYDGGPIWPDPNGASMELIAIGLDNNQGANWTTATNILPSGDKGTPGSAP